MQGSHESLIATLTGSDVLHTPEIIAAFRRVDRRWFVPPAVAEQAYENIPLPIGFGQTISQPLTVAIMMELLQPHQGDTCLDIGSGSGWVTALLAELVGHRGRVVALERIPQLVERTQQNVARFHYPHVTYHRGDGYQGWLQDAPYDHVHVAAASHELPKALVAQLRIGGSLIIPIGDIVQELALIRKTGDTTFHEQRFPGFQFVPLIVSGQS